MTTCFISFKSLRLFKERLSSECIIFSFTLSTIIQYVTPMKTNIAFFAGMDYSTIICPVTKGEELTLFDTTHIGPFYASSPANQILVVILRFIKAMQLQLVSYKG